MSLSIFNVAGAIESSLMSKINLGLRELHVGKYLGHAHINTSLEGLNSVESRPECVWSIDRTTVGWSGVKCEQCKTDVFLSIYGVMHVVVNCRKSKGKELKNWILIDVIPRGINKLIEKKHQKAIDEKDMQIALLDDDLTESQDLVKQLEYHNTGLQGEIRAKDQQIAHLQQQYVPLLEDESKNYGMTIIAKNYESAGIPSFRFADSMGIENRRSGWSY